MSRSWPTILIVTLLIYRHIELLYLFLNMAYNVLVRLVWKTPSASTASGVMLL